MNLIKNLSHQLLNTSSRLYKEYSAAGEQAMTTGDLDLFEKLTEQLYLTDLSNRENGRLNHSMLKTTFDSFQ